MVPAIKAHSIGYPVAGSQLAVTPSVSPGSDGYIPARALSVGMDAPFETTVAVRFRDVDAMGHVNNAVYATFLEEARAAYFREVLGERLDLVDTVLVSLAIEYRHEIGLGDEVTAALTVPDLGTSSIPMEYTIYAGDTEAATAETTQVLIDTETGSSRPLPDAWRRDIEAFEDW